MNQESVQISKKTIMETLIYGIARSMKVGVVMIAWILIPTFQYSQVSIADSAISLAMINVTYSPTIPGGDFKERYGFTTLTGAEFGVKLKNNFYCYTGANLLFGNTVKERVAGNVTFPVGDSAGGFLIMAIGSDGRYYTVRFFERGFVLPLLVGKIFPVFHASNRNSGIYTEAGCEFISHKVRINVIGNSVPQLNKTMLKGYDRLTTGIGLVQGIGYRHMSSNRLLNFYLGFEISENFTRSRRAMNYDTGISDTEQRLDLLYRFKVGWSFLIYNQAPRKAYYY